MATNTRKLSDFLAEGTGDTFGDLPVGKPHIKPGILYPAVHGVLSNSTGLNFIDTGNTGHTINSGINQRAYHTTGEKKNGNSSIYFTGESDDELQFPDHADFNWGANADFTYEFFVKAGDQADTYATVITDTANKVRVGFGDSATNLKLGVYFGEDDVWIQGTSDMSDDTDWHHCAVVREGTNLRLYVDGVQENVSANKGDASDCSNFRIGSYNGTTKRFKGYLDQLRISSNARYTGGTTFTPPTAQFTSDSNTKFLLQSNVSLPHSGNYGTVQSDGKSYYYTDIKGSKPIKDPRIGAHFGSQRHKWKSIQSLEHETGLQGQEVYSLDGRENMRACHFPSGSDYMGNDSNGNRLELNRTGSFVEVTGYFNAINLIHSQSENNHRLDILVNGTEAHYNLDLGADVANPLSSRYVDRGNLRKIDITSSSSSLSTDTPLAINTVKFLYPASSANNSMYGCELIAQDTSSTANRSKIQIPAQNVVSYGKKFSLSAAAHHYDPFNGFTNGTSLHSAFVDTATSLGLDFAPGSSAKWAISNSNNIRPYNGGRVVKWIASDGTIKTSVNMMPPNAQNILGTAVGTTEVTTPSATNTTPTPIFSDDEIDDSQAEVAKTFHWREFGNGSANGNSNYEDFSTVNSEDNRAWVMDDGLTAMSVAKAAPYNAGMGLGDGNGDAPTSGFISFIGTGIQILDKTTAANSIQYIPLVQNLPYGTHILKMTRQTWPDHDYFIDGVQIDYNHENSSSGYKWEFSFYQPKMPPIPEDACIIADYMLMADYVVQGSGGVQYLSKGTRRLSASRDIFYGGTDTKTLTTNPDPVNYRDLHIDVASNSTTDINVPAFGTRCLASGYNMAADNPQWKVNGSNVTGVTGNGSAGGSSTVTPAQTLDNNKFAITGATSGAMNLDGFFIDSPTHTSSHYQPFETPFLHELVGGDRNMEQTNLVVTADGKSWDEVTRDTSYMSSTTLALDRDSGEVDYNVVVIFDECRGHATNLNYINHHNKDFALAYDRQICLRDGAYLVNYGTLVASSANQQHCYLKVNGIETGNIYNADANNGQGSVSVALHLKRGDYLQIFGGHWSNNSSYSFYNIQRIDK